MTGVIEAPVSSIVAVLLEVDLFTRWSVHCTLVRDSGTDLPN